MRIAARVRRFARHATIALAGAAAPFTSCVAPPRTAPRPAAPAARADVVASNVARGDYVGSAACTPCHPEVARAWEISPMHRMTRAVPGADVQAPFDGTRWRFKDDSVVLERRGDDRFVRVEPMTGAARTYRVTRLIGGRVREDFAGVDVEGGRDNREEVVLPVSYLLATRAFRYKGYSVMVHERATLRAGPVWERTCIFCHNTVPEMDRLLGAIAGPRARPYQGQQVDGWLPEDRRGHVRVVDVPAFARAVRDEIGRLEGRLPGSATPRSTPEDIGPPPGERGAPAVARRAVDVVRGAFDGGALVEEGIGCEACHGGAREHARDPRVRPSFVPTAPWLDAAAPGPGRAAEVNRVCARCHQVLFSRYPYTWEGGRRDATAGGSHINSGEARDFLLGGCQGAMSCTRCHDPHGPQKPDALHALATPAGNATCTACHTGLADGVRLRAHAHHDPGGAGGACVACHMPRKNMGLDGVLTRYHRIGSPTDPARVLGDRPLECALCHADRSVGVLVDAMEKWWPVRYPRQRLEQLYGSLDANVIEATLARGKPHEQAVAIATLGELGARDAAPAVAGQLLNAYPLVREWAKRALASMMGSCDVDLAADDATIARQAQPYAHAPLAAPTAPADEEPED